jgi:hypothetical protein
MIKMSHIATALLLTSISIAHAETTNQPVAQGAASVEKNLNKNPDNKGLQRAAEQTQANEAKVAAKRAEADKRRDAKNKNAEKQERMEKRDMMERHEKMDRPAKMDRPGKVERPGR